MPKRLYLSEIATGDGLTPQTAFRPALRDIVPADWTLAADGRSDVRTRDGWLLIEADTDDAQHALLAADPRIVVNPTADVQDAIHTIERTVSDGSGVRVVSQATRTRLPQTTRER